MTERNLKEIIYAKGHKLNQLASEIGVDKATVTRWVQTKIPAEKVGDFERLTGISRQVLRPDLWPADIERPTPTPDSSNTTSEAAE